MVLLTFNILAAQNLTGVLPGFNWIRALNEQTGEVTTILFENWRVYLGPDGVSRRAVTRQVDLEPGSYNMLNNTYQDIGRTVLGTRLRIFMNGKDVPDGVTNPGWLVVTEPEILSRDFEIEFTDPTLASFKTSLSPSNFAVLQGLEAATNFWSIVSVSDSFKEPKESFQEIIDFINLSLAGLPELPEPKEGLTTNQKIGIVGVGIVVVTAIGAIINSKWKR